MSFFKSIYLQDFTQTAKTPVGPNANFPNAGQTYDFGASDQPTLTNFQPVISSNGLTIYVGNSPVKAPVSLGIFLTPINFAKNDRVKLRAKFKSLTGPEANMPSTNPNTVSAWGAVIQLRTGDLSDDLDLNGNSITRIGASLQHTTDKQDGMWINTPARLNAPKSGVTSTAWLSTANYDAIYKQGQVFELEMTADLGNRTYDCALLFPGSSTPPLTLTGVSLPSTSIFHDPNDPNNPSKKINAAGVAIAIRNSDFVVPASVAVLEFEIFLDMAPKLEWIMSLLYKFREWLRRVRIVLWPPRP